MSENSYIKILFLIILFTCSCGFVKENQHEVEEKPDVPSGEVWSGNLWVAADTTDSALFIPARMRYFEHYESIRFYVNITENSKKLFPLFEKRIITPEHFDKRWNASYTPTANDSMICKMHELDFMGKAVVISAVEYETNQGKTEVKMFYAPNGFPPPVGYCFYVKTEEKSIEEYLEALQRIDSLEICHVEI